MRNVSPHHCQSLSSFILSEQWTFSLPLPSFVAPSHLLVHCPCSPSYWCCVYARRSREECCPHPLCNHYWVSCFIFILLSLVWFLALHVVLLLIMLFCCTRRSNKEHQPPPSLIFVFIWLKWTSPPPSLLVFIFILLSLACLFTGLHLCSLLGEHYLLLTIIGLHATFVFPFMLFYIVRGAGKKGEL